MASAIPIYLNNLDRRPDRLAYMQAQADALGLSFVRHAAFDVAETPDAVLDQVTDRAGARIFMSRESACNVASHFAIHRRFLDTDAPAALVMEDDVALAPDMPAFVQDLDWLPPGIGVVQLERYGSGKSTRLVGPGLGRAGNGRKVRRLFSRVGGSACYIITREAAQMIAEHAGRVKTPIDHLLFSPNASPLYRDLGVGVVMPAPARQDTETFSSDIAASRARRQRVGTRHLSRGWMEVNRVPWQVAQMLRGARWRPFRFEAEPGT